MPSAFYLVPALLLDTVNTKYFTYFTLCGTQPPSSCTANVLLPLYHAHCDLRQSSRRTLGSSRARNFDRITALKICLLCTVTHTLPQMVFGLSDQSSHSSIACPKSLDPALSSCAAMPMITSSLPVCEVDSWCESRTQSNSPPANPYPSKCPPKPAYYSVRQEHQYPRLIGHYSTIHTIWMQIFRIAQAV